MTSGRRREAALLDPATLAGLRSGQAARATAARAVIAAHLAAHRGYVPWSGGKDSTVVVALARDLDPQVPVCFFDSGLEFPETYAYLDQLTTRWRLNLEVIPADPDALTVLVASGRWAHGAVVPDGPVPDLHEALIVRPARIAHARHGPGELWGLRAGESRTRRVALTRDDGTLRRSDGTVACAPIWRWRSQDVWGELARRGIPPNPVYDKLRRLGADERSLRVGLVVDGNGLEHGRITWLRRGWPQLYAQLEAQLPRLREWR
jgi:phosphoadenosine phosphosulfate reductase